MEVTLIGFPASFAIRHPSEAAQISRHGLLRGITLCEDSRKRSPDTAKRMCDHGQPFCFIAGGINTLYSLYQQETRILDILSALPPTYLLSPERIKHPLIQLIKDNSNFHTDQDFWSLLASYEMV